MLQEIPDESLEPEVFVAPASFAQRRLWLLDRLKPGLAVYNVPVALRLRGPLRVPALAAALEELVARHETLRTSFAEEEGEPVQRILPELSLPLPAIDLGALPAGRREEEVHRQVRRDAAEPFDLGRAPLLRAFLFWLDGEEHALFLNLHHIVVDAWSLALLLGELLALYGTFLRGLPSPLPELPIQYADFAAWQREQLQGETLERKLAPWRRRLEGAPQDLPLPVDRPRREGMDDAGGVLPFDLPPELAAGLRELSRETGATLFMVLLASFQALLSRESGRTDLVVGSPVAGRGRVETEGLVGFFVNTLALRGDLSGDPSFRELVGRARAVAVEAFAHDDLPFEKLVEEICPERRGDRNPLFQVAFGFVPPMLREDGKPEIGIEVIQVHSGTAKFDLTLSLSETPDGGIQGFWEYAAALFDPATVARLSGHWRNLLANALAHPDRRLSDLALLSGPERHQLAVEWNDVRSDYPREATIPGLFAAVAETSPEAPAVVSAAGAVTYRELARRSRALARRLRAAGVGPDDRVGVFLERGPEMVAAWLAALEAGGGYLPLDPVYPAGRLAFMLADGGVRALVTRRELAGRLPQHGASVLFLEETAEDGDAPLDPSGATPDSLAYVVYTSGSTGAPKGVAVPQRAVVRLVRGSDYVFLSPADRVAQVSNASFDAATFEVWGALLNGGALVCVERDVTLSPEDFAREIRERGVTAMFLTTSLFNRLVGLDPAAFATVRHLIVGGEAVDPARMAEALAAGPPERLLNGYGPTEGTTFTTWQRVREAAPGVPVPIGRPLANTTVTLLDAALRPVPIGVAGELCLGGDGLARGYAGRPELTAGRFVPRPEPLGEDAAPGGRLYRTGDLARYRPDGAIDYLGRLDAQLKIRGFRVEPGEVEATLAAHPGLAGVAVGARRRESGELALIAWIVPRVPHAAPAPRELRDFLADRLPEPMIPTAFVALDALPRTANGKVDREALPDPEARGESAGWVAPATPVEEVLAGIWAEVLRIPPGRVGSRDSFFDLGGHSLTATAVTSLARATFRVELPTRTLFERPLLADLAARVEELLQAGEGVDLPPIVPQPREEEIPLSFAQQRLWFLDELAGGETPFYNIAAALSLTGRLDVRALERAAGEIVRRHEALRTTFRGGPEGRPSQTVHPWRPFALPLADLGGLPPAAREAEARLQTRQGTARPFPLTRGPLLRLELLRLEEERHVLVLAMHHIVSDGWSLEVFVRELAALYAAYAAGRPSPLPELPVQYPDFAVWQRRWLGGSSLDGQLAYWKRQLAGAPLVFELPPDRPRPAVQTYEGGKAVIQLPSALAEGLHALARGHRVTLFMTLLAAFASLLERHTGRRDLLLGTPIANRNRAETAPLIGFFVNMLVLRADLAGDPRFDALLARVRETALGAYAHQDLPFERLVEELQPARDLSRHPVFQIGFAMANAPWQGLDLPGVELGFLGEASSVELYDLSLLMTEDGENLLVRLSYNADLYDEATVRRLGRHLEALLEGVAADPRRPAAAIDLLAPAERRQLLEEWSGAIPVPAPPAAVHELFAEQVRLRPAAPALLLKGAEISYEELDRRANRLAHHFRALGLGSEGMVALVLPDAADFAAAALGAGKAGGAFVPLDPRWPAERLAWVLADSRALALVTRGSILPDSPAGLPVVDLETDREEIARRPPTPPVVESDPDQLAYASYTSGSTGTPKGVLVSRRAFALHLLSVVRLAEMGPGDRQLVVFSFTSDMGIEQVFRPLVAGAAVVPWNPEVRGVPEWERVLRESGATHADPPTALWHQAAVEWAEGRSRVEPLPALRWLLVGGEALPTGALALWERTPLAAVPLSNAYGPTEAVVFTTCHLGWPGDGDAWRRHRLPIGRPVAPNAVYLLDDRGKLAPPGGVGEICVGGFALARGYLGRPDLTAAAFVPDPFSGVPGARLYRTGDLARFLAGGDLDFLDRRDDQMKLLGYRIEPGEVETALARHPKVRAAAVALVEGQDGIRTLAAWVVAAASGGSEEPSAAELREHLQRKLPPHMVPSSFHQIDELPLTSTGKIDRKALSRRPLAPEAPPEPAPAAGPPVEQIVAGLWKEILGLDEVGLDDNFFDLGGHSMLMAWVRAKLQEAFGIDLDTVELFNHPTVRQLSERLRREMAPAEAPAATPEPEPAPAAEPAIRSTDIAVVGMAARLPGAGDVDQLWRNLRDGVESISWFESGWTPPGGGYYRVPAHGDLEGADLFDAPFFGYSPRESELMDPQHRVFLECAWEALEDAGYAPERCPGAVGVFAGGTKTDYLARLFAAGVFADPAGSHLALHGTFRDNLPLRVSYKLGLEGPSLNVQTTCSTSLVAVHLACRSLLDGDCDMALAGGISVGANAREGYFYRPGDVLSPDGHCRAFDARAAGTVDADGVAIVVLKRLADALRDGDRVHAVIKGSGVNNDGSGKVGFMAPRMATQSRLIRSVLDRAGIPAETVTYVEAHGTATALGDPIEVAALTDAFRQSTGARGFCALGSLKTNIGHPNAAAGTAGLIKAVLALEHRQIPPSLHYESPNPEIDFETSPFFVNTRLRDWEVPEGMPRRAAVNSFGVGGTNAHVVLEEAPPAARTEDSDPHPWRLLVLSARSAPSLDAATSRLALHLERNPDLPLSDVAFTLQVGRRAFGHRRAVLCQDADEAVSSLGLLDPGRTATGLAAGRAPVFLFPGQGAQRPGLGAGLYESEPLFREEIDRCAELLRPHLGRDVREILFQQDAEIDRTELTQPALFTLEWALARLWMSWGVTPEAMLGHSLGEYVAAALAGVFSLPDALALVAARGRLIGGLPGGAMLAVPLPPGELEPLLAEGLSLAAVNGPSRSVLSGPEEAIAALQDRLSRRGVAGRRLAVSHAFHSAMMDPILAEFGAEVRKLELRPPSIPFLSNLTGRWMRPEEATDPDYWVRHLRNPVRFAEGMAELLADPARVFLEVGPGRSLANAARQVRAGQAPPAVFPSLPQPGETTLPDPAWMLLTLGRLWTEGVEVDWPALHAGRARHRVPLPTYPFEHRSYWVEVPEMADAAPAGPRISDDPAEWFHVPYWRPALPAAGAGPSGPRLLFLDEAGLGRRLERLLREGGVEVVTVEPGDGFARTGERSYLLHPGRGEDYESLIADLGARGLFPAEVVHLWNVGTPVDIDAAEILAFHSPLLLAHALAPAASQPVRVLLVSTGLHAVTGREAIEPAKALLLGPCRSMPQRFTGLACRAVDVELEAGGEDELARLLRAELAGGGDEPVVAYRGRQRWAQDFTPQRLDFPGPVDRFREGGVYVVTGGLGGVGSTLAAVLYERCHARLVIVGRSLPTDPESRRLGRLRDLERRGAEVLFVAADVADPEAMREVRRQAEERFGAVHGIVHAAGVPGPAMIDWSRPEAAAETFAAKVRGTLALAEAFAGAPLDFFILCSSGSSLLGGLGQVGYAAGNAFLDAFAWSRGADPRTYTVAIDWPLWSDVGFEAENQGEHGNRRRTAGGLLSRQAIEAFQRILGYGFPQIVVSQIDIRDLMAATRSWETSGFRAMSREGREEAPATPAPLPARSAPTAYEDEVEAAIAEVWRELLGVREPAPQDNFFALGGDSLIALGLSAKLHDRFRVELGPGDVFEAATLGELAAAVRRQLSTVTTLIQE